MQITRAGSHDSGGVKHQQSKKTVPSSHRTQRSHSLSFPREPGEPSSKRENLVLSRLAREIGDGDPEGPGARALLDRVL